MASPTPVPKQPQDDRFDFPTAQRKLGAILASMSGTPTYGAGGETGDDRGHQSVGAEMMGDSNRHTDDREACGWACEKQGPNSISQEAMLDKQLRTQQ